MEETLNESIEAFQHHTTSIDNVEPVGPPVALSKSLRDLYTLWKEYEEGLEGRKEAKLFTAHEHG